MSRTLIAFGLKNIDMNDTLQQYLWSSKLLLSTELIVYGCNGRVLYNYYHIYFINKSSPLMLKLMPSFTVDSYDINLLFQSKFQEFKKYYFQFD